MTTGTGVGTSLSVSWPPRMQDVIQSYENSQFAYRKRAITGLPRPYVSAYIVMCCKNVKQCRNLGISRHLWISATTSEGDGRKAGCRIVELWMFFIRGGTGDLQRASYIELYDLLDHWWRGLFFFWGGGHFNCSAYCEMCFEFWCFFCRLFPFLGAIYLDGVFLFCVFRLLFVWLLVVWLFLCLLVLLVLVVCWCAFYLFGWLSFCCVAVCFVSFVGFIFLIYLYFQDTCPAMANPVVMLV